MYEKWRKTGQLILFILSAHKMSCHNGIIMLLGWNQWNYITNLTDKAVKTKLYINKCWVLSINNGTKGNLFTVDWVRHNIAVFSRVFMSAISCKVDCMIVKCNGGLVFLCTMGCRNLKVCFLITLVVLGLSWLMNS